MCWSSFCEKECSHMLKNSVSGPKSKLSPSRVVCKDPLPQAVWTMQFCMSSLVFSFLEFMVEMQCCLWALFKGRFSDSDLVKTWKRTNKTAQRVKVLVDQTWHLSWSPEPLWKGNCGGTYPSTHSAGGRPRQQNHLEPKGQTSWSIYPARQNKLLKTIYSLGTHSKTETKRQTENWVVEHWRRADEMVSSWTCQPSLVSKFNLPDPYVKEGPTPTGCPLTSTCGPCTHIHKHTH